MHCEAVCVLAMCCVLGFRLGQRAGARGGFPANLPFSGGDWESEPNLGY